MENEKEIERIQLENKRRHRSQMYSTIPIQHPSLSISEKAIIQYNKRKEFNDADIQRLLHYKVIKNTNIKQSLYDINHINNINDIIEKKGNKNDILLNSYSDLFTEKKRILDDKDISLYDNNGKYKTILNLEIDPYKKYCDLNPIIEYEINKALNDKSMKNGNFFWYKSEKKPIERIDIMTNEMSGSFIPHLMKGSKLTKPTSSYNNNGIDNLPNINDKTT
ncbi:hypothetical protein BCR32DRAFT_289992 [Anaeromyces robustus]|uniref:Uncharacterized protein n=1 Tax=Anaeromyces robustus TaxID=1754192 RepID=A0A1Y1XKX6_9FUNG|nr:hypothetical protein BCR32DRAFT_289992 [Anaeromyces robustus]|eukprot:ORX86408.1 hypothetical protein BCR32DRAFT_289992 [Anaeromyces robustus]